MDGIVRLFRNYDPTLEQGPLQMVSSFRALNEIIQMQKGSGLVLDWKQSTGSLLVGGDSRVIKVWDAQTETQILVRTAAQNLNLFFFTDKSFFFSIGSGDEFRESGDGHSLRWWKFAKIYCQV